MKNTFVVIAAFALVLTAGCKNEQTSSTATPVGNEPAVSAQANMTPEDLGTLGAKIKKNPGEAQQLLSQAGLTEESFEQAVRKVAENPEQSKRYAAAYKSAS